MSVVGPAEVQAQLSDLFGSYRAEWLREHLFDFYTSPIYFPELTTNRSCVLIGGRGTGKTTALRALSWEGQQHLAASPPSDWPYYGVYYRVDTNRVSAFRGPEVDSDRWRSLFGHYFNLLIGERLLAFASWYEDTLNAADPLLSGRGCGDVAASFSLPDPVDSLPELRDALRRARLEFEGYLNNAADQASPSISLQGVPISALVEELSRHPSLDGKLFFIVIDEYENLLDDQQRVVNTLLKHADASLSYKIGVRELGYRQRTTVNEHEQLRSPSDYVRIDIGQKLDGVFSEFATRVCDDRISRLRLDGEQTLGSIKDILPRLSEDDEATLLGVESQADSFRSQLAAADPETDLEQFDALPPLYQYLIGFWSSAHGARLPETYASFINERDKWDTRYGNYKHALLYTLKRKRRGIQKYYSGWDTYTQLAGNNIRFYLQLVETSLLLHLETGKSLAVPVSPDIQTKAAQAVGRTNLSELEGLSVYGMYLSRLVLGLGRIFEVLAKQLEGRAPEVNQFYLAEDEGAHSSGFVEDDDVDLDRLLTESVMHLALVRFPGTKPTQDGDTEDYDYSVHPIFAPLFGFSYRRKRKMSVRRSELSSLIRSPRSTIRSILGSSRSRPIILDDELPDQLALFESFYRSDG